MSGYVNVGYTITAVVLITYTWRIISRTRSVDRAMQVDVREQTLEK